MAVKKKKIGAAGRFGAGYGKVKQKLVAVESIQRKKQDNDKHKEKDNYKDNEKEKKREA